MSELSDAEIIREMHKLDKGQIKLKLRQIDFNSDELVSSIERLTDDNLKFFRQLGKLIYDNCEIEIKRRREK